MNQANLLDQKTHFAFGENWLDYARKIEAPHIDHAVTDWRRLLGGAELAGKTFLDIGCGSGLHALAALRLGAARVVGTDIDPDSVAAARAVLDQFAPDAASELRVCSVFDMTPEEFGTFDMVYSRGVLHHTGDMDCALARATALVAPGGTFLVALYKKTPFCGVWRAIKRWYSRSGTSAQRRARGVYVSCNALPLGSRVVISMRMCTTTATAVA